MNILANRTRKDYKIQTGSAGWKQICERTVEDRMIRLTLSGSNNALIFFSYDQPAADDTLGDLTLVPGDPPYETNGWVWRGQVWAYLQAGDAIIVSEHFYVNP